MDLKLKNKTALVTGASQGIGRAIALELAREGCHVALCGRSEAPLKQAAAQIEALGVQAVPICADVLDAQDAQRLVEQAATRLEGLDVLVNNVGGNVPASLKESTDEDWEQTFQLNVFQGVRLTRLAVGHLRQGSSVVYVSSISGWIPQLVGSLQYGASKAAAIFMAEPMALELVHEGIRVNVVSPGSIMHQGGGWERVRQETPEKFAAYERDGFPMGRLGTPEEVADVVVFLASPRSHWVNGANIRVDGLEQPVPVQRPW